MYTKANSQRNTDFGIHFFVFIFIKIFFMDNIFDNKNNDLIFKNTKI